MRVAAKRRNDFEPVEMGGMIMIFGDQFATESGRSRKLQPRWRGPFVVVEYDEHTQNYTVSMDSRIYRRQRGVFHCSVVKPYHSNDDERFPGRAQLNQHLSSLITRKSRKLRVFLTTGRDTAEDSS